MPRAYWDPLREIDDRLERWRKWHRRETGIGLGGGGNPLSRMQAEAAEVARGSARVEKGEAVIRTVRKVLLQRARRFRLHYEQFKDERSIVMATRLEYAAASQPVHTDTLPWASLIHGQGARQEERDMQSERVDEAVRDLPRAFRRVIRLAYLSDLPPSEKAKALGLGSERGYYHRLRLAKVALVAKLRNEGNTAVL